MADGSGVKNRGGQQQAAETAAAVTYAAAAAAARPAARRHVAEARARDARRRWRPSLPPPSPPCLSSQTMGGNSRYAPSHKGAPQSDRGARMTGASRRPAGGLFGEWSRRRQMGRWRGRGWGRGPRRW
eukprot:TRINITY_DN987_c0_g1_i2.p4 TRINITY_DN987_c0_g1~~TRINITY_DN987_c0_g1_i2.p4  ORF type:complete len:128 (+),score=7.17 TRINITY_DN987_c0_g1_i2:596-979(+)